MVRVGTRLAECIYRLVGHYLQESLGSMKTWRMKDEGCMEDTYSKKLKCDA
jgi:hypothetical protein